MKKSNLQCVCLVSGDEGVSQRNGNSILRLHLNYFNAKGLYQHLLDFDSLGIKETS
jgi:hypothetical protein